MKMLTVRFVEITIPLLHRLPQRIVQERMSRLFRIPIEPRNRFLKSAFQSTILSSTGRWQTNLDRIGRNRRSLNHWRYQDRRARRRRRRNNWCNSECWAPYFHPALIAVPWTSSVCGDGDAGRVEYVGDKVPVKWVLIVQCFQGEIFFLRPGVDIAACFGISGSARW